MKKRPDTILFVILLFVFFSVLSGCGEKDSAEKPTTLMQTETTTAATLAPTPTPTPTITPTPTVTPTPTPSIEDELAIAPEVPGLSKEIQNGDVVYVAIKGNEYGIEVGEICGKLISKDVISVEGVPTTGIVFDSRVVKVLLNKAIVENPVTIVLPIVVSEVDTFEINTVSEEGFEWTGVVVNSNKPIEIINTTFSDTQFYASDNEVKHSFTILENGKNFDLEARLIHPSKQGVTFSKEEAMNLMFYYGDFNKENLLFDVPTGSSLGVEIISPMVIFCGGTDAGTSLESSNILKLSDGTVILQEEIETSD